MLNALGELQDSLKKHLFWSKYRMECMSHMLLGLFVAGTVNLRRIAICSAGAAQPESRYRRLQRFFAHFKIDLTPIARWLFNVCFQPGEKVYLTMDRTNWKWGKQPLNIFMLAAVYKGLAVPLFWSVLSKGGSSNHTEQKALIQKFLDAFGRDRIAGILADREFSNGPLFQWLNSHGIPFFIRIKGNAIARIGNKRLLRAARLFSEVNANGSQIFGMAVEIYGQRVYLTGARSEKGELMIVATPHPCRNTIETYLRRWQIEALFQSLKERGFHFEDTRITCPERMTKLTVLLAIGFVWAHKIGEWQALKKPIRLKRFKDSSQRLQHSFFRYGFDFLRETLRPFQSMAEQFRACVRVLSEACAYPAYAG